MNSCEHDPVYSGQVNLNQRHAWICRRCGDSGWSEHYEVSRVDFDEYLHLRVTFGWNSPKLPPPPRTPTRVSESSSLYVGPMLLFAALFAIIGLCGVPWYYGRSLLETWQALIGSGVALGMWAICFVCWKTGR